MNAQRDVGTNRSDAMLAAGGARSAVLSDSSRTALAHAMAQVNTLVLGKPREVDLAFACLLAGGHLLIEDLPGLGKTTLARALAATLGLGFARMQFTADLLPSDILGVSIYEQDQRNFRFHPGPVFTQLLLADEINRAPPRTQSALLEAMAEHQVTIDGVCHALPNPFFVIATQNPVDLAGTFPLPDSQLDRFLLRIALGYPDATAEREMLVGADRRDLIAGTLPLIGTEDVLALRHAVTQVHASDALVSYVQALLTETRRHPQVRVGLSPRAGLALLRAARALALLRGRDHALPEDIQAVFEAVAAHRLVPQGDTTDRVALARSILKSVAVE
jgi:MoxR-like ATPase